MKRSDKVIITCAVTGSIHTPTMSPHLPLTPDEIIRDSVAAAEAGAAMLHLHARDPETGKPSPSLRYSSSFCLASNSRPAPYLILPPGAAWA